jgi:hypothetical protein
MTTTLSFLERDFQVVAFSVSEDEYYQPNNRLSFSFESNAS